MKMLRSTSLKSIFHNAYLKISAVLLIIAAIGFSTVGHYGVSWDESLEIGMVKSNFDLIVKGKPLPTDLKHYGVLFNLSSEVVYQLKKFSEEGLSYDPLAEAKLNVDNNQETFQQVIYKGLYERIKVKHPFTFFVSLIAYISVAGLTWILAGKQYAWFAPIVLALIPRFWGHSFFNPKDIPFAAMLTLGTWVGTCLIGYYFKQEAQGKVIFGFNRITTYSLLYGVLVGLATGTRIGGFFLLFFFGVAHFATRIVKGNFLQYLLRFWKFYLLIGVAWAITTTAIHPSAWSNPAGWFIGTLQYLSAHVRDAGDLFEGKNWHTPDLPWYYLPKWMLISIPAIFQVAFWGGVIWIAFKYKKLSDLQRAGAIFVLLQVFFMPTIAILKDANIYGGMRQFLFVLPGVATIAAMAMIWFYQILQKKFWGLAYIAQVTIFLSPIVLDMIAIHPYQYAYFNREIGGLPQAVEQYDTDYWSLSLREGMEWLNANGKPNSTVLVAGSFHAARIFADMDQFALFEYKPAQNEEAEQSETPDYFLVLHRWRMQDKYPECQVVHQVARQNVPLASVKQCSDFSLNIER